MSKNIIASIPGIALYQDGIYYKSEATGCLVAFYAVLISQEGFAPIEHVNAIEVAEGRDLNAMVFAIITIPLIIGIVLLLLWIFQPHTVVRVRSEGEVFATVVISKRHRDDALDMVNKYRRLKLAIAQQARKQAA